MQLNLKPSPMSSDTLTDIAEWRALEEHCSSLKNARIADLFEQDPSRFDAFHLKYDGLLFDYAKHHVTQETLDNLLALAKMRDVEGWRDRLFSGGIVNTSERRPSLHTALRGSCDPSLEVEGDNVHDFVAKTLKRIQSISMDIRSNSDISDVLCLGIGGSDLGGRLVCGAFENIANGPKIHFVSNIDGTDISETLKDLKPHSTIVIVASKTFTTLETIQNAIVARDWMGSERVSEQFYAVTINNAAAQDFGVSPDHILPLREWIGGRYSVWGAIGLPIAIALGFDQFQRFLDGAKSIDTHFQTAPLESNIPVLMAMLGVWYTNFWEHSAHAILPYAQQLSAFPSFIQQLDMESNGKSVDRDGQQVLTQTGPVVFGGIGTDSQHAFFQLLHQGTHIIPADFIAFTKASHDLDDHNTQLLANALAQSQALMQGDHNPDEPHRNFDGNRPSSTLLFDTLDPYALGMLIALYEHKIFIQGVVWGINSFDQWGVELGKKLAQDITNSLQDQRDSGQFDSSTHGLIQHIKENS